MHGAVVSYNREDWGRYIPVSLGFMGSSQLNMNNSNTETTLAILLLEAITDLSSCIFIIICLSHGGFQRTNTAPLNRILISLNVSNVFYTIFMLAYSITSSLWPHLYSVRSIFYFISYMTLYSITSSTWLTATLCFFFSIKIIPSQPGVLMNIKNKIGAIVWWLILMVEVVSVGGSFLSILISFQNPNEKNSTMNHVETVEEKIRRNLKLSNMVLILNCLPFLLIIMMTVASAWFLRGYNSQMKNNGTLVNTNVKDYRSAVQTMTGLLIFYLFIFLAVVILALEIFVDRSAGFWICSMFLLSFPTGQSTLLIYSNPRLKQTLKKLLTKLTCRGSGD